MVNAMCARSAVLQLPGMGVTSLVGLRRLHRVALVAVRSYLAALHMVIHRAVLVRLHACCAAAADRVEFLAGDPVSRARDGREITPSYSLGVSNKFLKRLRK
jgi:hypothetical protein